MAEPKTIEMTEDELQEKIDAAVDGLKAKNDELLGEVKKYKREARATKDVDPAEVARLREEIDELKGDNSKLKTDYEKAVKDGKKTIDTLTEKATKAESHLTKVLKDDGLTNALVTVGVKKEFLPAVKAMLREQVQLVPDGDEFKAQVGDKALADFVKEWSQGDDGKNFVAAPNNSGGGAGGGAGGGGGAKSIKREAFTQLSPAEQMAHVKGGGVVAD